MRFVVAAAALIVLVGPVVWATLSKRGRVSGCCSPGDPKLDKRMTALREEPAVNSIGAERGTETSGVVSKT